ncbi:SusC/RagA family TonB-linked outer membrane protein [Nafulsella turpanensis]|uniref:SusC/RagA family TonB-linked outer membrane protein n=1 Tax=Nafulsella turpanensis TaxID=1265690 RepID=UPI000348ADF1|nr:SusC/RagA family TonB-linked outer membrane protein [Nafulsella turpanensis]
MKRILLISFVLMSSLISEAFAQRTVTGTVTSGVDGTGLPGVAVRVQGTTTGVTTNFDGEYRLEVPEGHDVLVFSFVGFNTEEVAIGNRSVIDVVLMEDVKQLQEVVVTALGIEKSKNELSYAAQTVDAEAISQTRETNFVNSLSGRVAGLNIKRSNTMGGSTNVIIRGTTSLTGNNQALFVVDGVPINNDISNTSSQMTGRGGFDYGNPAADINPDNIASVTVLKGAAATVLYGSRAANGVIMITTKKGTEGLGVVVNSGITTGSIDESTFPTYQNRYGAGYYPWFEGGYFLLRDIDGDGEQDRVISFDSDASYGAEFNPNLLVYHWDAFDPASPNFMTKRPYVAAENGALAFYETPYTYNNSIFIDGGNEKGTFKLGYTRVDEIGILPNSEIDKNLVTFGATYNVTEDLTANASINYTNTEGLGRYGTGYDSRNPNQSFRQWWQTNVDVVDLRDAYFRNRQNITWNWYGPERLEPIYMDNPYWTRYENFQNDERNRYFGKVGLTYDVAEWFNILARASADSYSEIQEERIAVGSVDVPMYMRFNRDFIETNYDLIGNFNRELSEDFSIDGLIGTNYRTTRQASIRAETNGGLQVPDLFALNNSANPIEAPVEVEENVRVIGVFAQAGIGFQETIFLEGAIRRDVSSTLPAGENAFYYPSISTSFVFSELVEPNAIFTYGKLRANYAEVGNGAPAYALRDPYILNTPFNGVPVATLPSTKFNPNLKPERTKSWEVGLESSFLDGRVGVDASYYYMNSVDQIFRLPVSSSTGNYYRYINAGSVVNRGLEVQFFATPVRTDDFSWTATLNWARNRNVVESIYTDEEGNEIQNLLLADPQGGITINAALGEPYGTIRGTNFVYNDLGQKIVGEDGFYLQSESANEVIGDANPDWTGGLSNSLRYKNFELDFLIDMQRGGDIWSLDLYYGMGTGLYPETAGLNDLGNPVRDRVADGGGVLLEGVNEDGEPNTVRAEAYYYGNPFGWAGAPNAQFIYDASYIKLRSASLTYKLPEGIVERAGGVIKSADISLIGTNLWIIDKNLPYADPEAGLSAGNIQGYQSGVYPTVRSYGFNVKLQF